MPDIIMRYYCHYKTFIDYFASLFIADAIIDIIHDIIAIIDDDLLIFSLSIHLLLTITLLIILLIIIIIDYCIIID
jgi:hypothetical protein